jgi:DNA-binding MarR family transcriptional regulator
MTTSTPPPPDPALRTLRLFPRLHRWAVATVQANQWGQGLSMRQLGVLTAVRDGVSSPGLLARRLLVTPAVITGLVDRLERQGYVRREAQADDRRRLRLVLTKSGRAVCESLQQALVRELAAQLGSEPEQLRLLGVALEQLERAMTQLETRTSPLALTEAEEPEAPEPVTRARKRPAKVVPRAGARGRSPAGS